MKIYSFWGESDDLFCMRKSDYETGETEFEDEIYGPVILTNSDITAGVVVKGYYEFKGCWGLNVFPCEEDFPFPANWEFRMKLGGRGYSTELSIVVPDDTIVRQLTE